MIGLSGPKLLVHLVLQQNKQTYDACTIWTPCSRNNECVAPLKETCICIVHLLCVVLMCCCFFNESFQLSGSVIVPLKQHLVHYVDVLLDVLWERRGEWRRGRCAGLWRWGSVTVLALLHGFSWAETHNVYWQVLFSLYINIPSSRQPK